MLWVYLEEMCMQEFVIWSVLWIFIWTTKQRYKQQRDYSVCTAPKNPLPLNARGNTWQISKLTFRIALLFPHPLSLLPLGNLNYGLGLRGIRALF